MPMRVRPVFLCPVLVALLLVLSAATWAQAPAWLSVWDAVDLALAQPAAIR